MNRNILLWIHFMRANQFSRTVNDNWNEISKSLFLEKEFVQNVKKKIKCPNVYIFISLYALFSYYRLHLFDRFRRFILHIAIYVDYSTAIYIKYRLSLSLYKCTCAPFDYNSSSDQIPHRDCCASWSLL